MTNLVRAYEDDDIREFEKILKVCVVFEVFPWLMLSFGFISVDLTDQSRNHHGGRVHPRLHRRPPSKHPNTSAVEAHSTVQAHSNRLHLECECISHVFNRRCCLFTFCVFLKKIAPKELNIADFEVEELIVSLILDDAIDGHIDQVNGLLILSDKLRFFLNAAVVVMVNDMCQPCVNDCTGRRMQESTGHLKHGQANSGC